MKSLRSTISVKGSRAHIASEVHKKKVNTGSEAQIDVISYAVPPWPEWSDADLNAEKWNVTQPASPKPADRRRPSMPASASLLCFQDPMGHAQLPPSLEAESWVRLMSMGNMKVYDESTAEEKLLDLISPNTHLLRSDVMRWIMASIMTLYHLGRSGIPELEGQGKDFAISSNFWKPWQHIYALCKVAKGTTHKPVINPSGKYVVRLFYMGCWRRITVDDYVPLDWQNRSLLPMTASGTEMWPILLTKALLKVASLSWNAQAEIRDFSVIGSLTGWHAQDLELDQVPPRTIWWLCQKLLTGLSEDPDERFVGVKETVVSAAYETCRRYSHGPSETPSFGTDLTDPNAEVFGAVVMCAVVETEGHTDQYPDHPILLTQARMFLQVEEDRPPTPVWKTFRWKKWAIDQGIILEDSKKFIKGIRIFSPIEKLKPDITRLLPKSKTPAIEVPESNKRKSKKGHRDSKPPEAVDPAEAIYPEYWVEFGNLVSFLKRFRIYYTTSAFEHNLKLTDIYTLTAEKTTAPAMSPKKAASVKDLRAHSSASLVETNIKKSPVILYLMIDSMTCKKLLVTFSAMKPFSAANLDPLNLSRTNLVPEPSIPTYYFMGEDYDWKANSVGEIKFAIKTVGSTCQLIQLREGLIVIRLWIKLPDVYAVRISSQTPFVLGTRDKIQGLLGGESESWLSYGVKFSSAWNRLVKIDVNTDDHQELLEKFCKSYLPVSIPKPFQKYTTRMKRKVTANFENTLIELLLENTTDTDSVWKTVQYWQWLLMNGNFGCKSLQDTPVGKICIPQSEAKSFIMRNYSPRGSRTSQATIARLSGNGGLPEEVTTKYSLPFDRLLTSDIITFDKRSGVNFLKRMFGNDQDILKFYPFRDDDKYLVSFVDYTGTARNTLSDWVPLVRFEVNTHRDENPFCSIYLATPVSSGLLQIVNNDTLEEIPRFFDGVEPSYYPANRHGYTIFASAFVADRDRRKDIQWKIRIASHSNENLPHICSKKTSGICSEQQPPSLSILEVKDHYIPNKEKIVFKCLLTVQQSQTLSMRCVMSRKCAEFILRIRDNNEKIIKEYTAIGEIIVPVVRLTGKDSGGPDYFVIEAQVLRKTWKLSPDEKTIVNSLREKDRKKSLMFTREGDIQESSSHIFTLVKMIRNSVNFEDQRSSCFQLVPNAPYWRLALVVDQDMSSTVNFVKDHREEEQIRQIKAAWEVGDPGRYKRSYELRKEFLENKLYCKKFDDDINAVQSESKCGIILKNIAKKESDHIIVFDEKYLTKKLIHRRENRSKYEEEYSDIRAKFSDIRSQQSLRIQKLSQRITDSREKSKEMISGAYDGRNNYVSDLIQRIEAEKKAAALELKNLKKGKSGQNPKGTKASSTKSKK